MITLLTYWWYLMWNLQTSTDTAKGVFGIISSMEIFVEIFIIACFVCICYWEKWDEKI